MQRDGIDKVGANLSQAGQDLEDLSGLLSTLEGTCGQRMTYASEQMTLAGNNLQGIAPTPSSGKSWLKGGL